MAKPKGIFCLIVISFFSLAGRAQTVSAIKAMESQYQSCLDKGEYMLGCSKAYYRKMDSVLNIAYNTLRSSLDPSKQAELKTGQKQWLAKRDKYFRELKTGFTKAHPGIDPYGNAIGARDDAMFMIDEQARFVQKRVLVLIGKMKNTDSK